MKWALLLFAASLLGHIDSQDALEGVDVGVVEDSAPTCSVCKHDIGGVRFLPNGTYCRAYTHCVPTAVSTTYPQGYYPVVKCCREGTYWDQRILNCRHGNSSVGSKCIVDVPIGGCPAPWEPPEVPTEENCTLEAHPNATLFINSGHVQSCPPKTVFDETMCHCIHDGSPPPPPCYEMIQFKFTENFHSYSCRNTVYGSGHGNVVLKDKAACFNGKDAYMQFYFLNNWFVDNPPASTFSIAVWASGSDAMTGFGGLLCNGDCHTHWSYCLGMDSSRVSGGIFGDNDAASTSFGADGPVGGFATNVWHHFALTYDGKEARLYRDGKHETSGYPNGPIRNVQASSTIGLICNSDDSYAFFHGCIDDATYITRVLTDDDVAAMFTAGRSS